MPIDTVTRRIISSQEREFVVGMEPCRQGECTTGMQNTAIEQRVHRVLDDLGMSYEAIPIDPHYADTAAFCEHYGFPLDHSANTIIIGSKKEPKHYCACVVLATTRLDVNHMVRRLMGVSRASFASAEETMALTGMLIGGVTVFALPPDLPIYIDAPIMSLDYVILGGGSRALKIKVAPEALRRLPHVRIVAGLGVGV